MTSEKISALLNRQINAELYSAYLYWYFAGFFDSSGLKGFAGWYRIQADEELSHAKKICAYMNERGCPVVLNGIDAPSGDLTDSMTVAQMGLKHEKLITEMIDEIYREAFKERDFGTMCFLDWFVDEQIEEETNARDIISLLNMSGSSGAALYLADLQMGSRKRGN